MLTLSPDHDSKTGRRSPPGSAVDFRLHTACDHALCRTAMPLTSFFSFAATSLGHLCSVTTRAQLARQFPRIYPALPPAARRQLIAEPLR